MLDLRTLGFAAVDPSATGRRHPAVLLKLYVYDAIPSSRRLEREAAKLMWPRSPDHKTRNFRKDHGPAIQQACAQFVGLCRELGRSLSNKFKAEGWPGHRAGRAYRALSDSASMTIERLRHGSPEGDAGARLAHRTRAPRHGKTDVVGY